MRVISGTARGRKLKELSGTAIMPTSDMVKESVFNIIQFDIEGRRVLDLFAGTGQMGVEALSRGAGSVVFVDSSPEAGRIIIENIKSCGFSEAAKVYVRDALKYLESEETFDIIFIDPPYDTMLVGKALERIIEFDKLTVNGIIMCELRADSEAPVVSPPYVKHREYRYGGVKLIKICKELL